MDWVEQEYDSVDMGDIRLNERARAMLKRFAENPQKSIPSTFHTWAETKAAYRFFDNPKVTAKKVIKPHQLATLARMKEHPTVLLVEDTTSLNYSGQTERKDLGPLQQNNVRGLFLHPMLAVTPERLCLGVVSYEQWSRNELVSDSKTRKAKRGEQPIEKKESYRWVNGYKKASKLSQTLSETNFVYIADRESDIYDIYQQSAESVSGEHADWIIRSTYDRSVLDVNAATGRNKLKAKVKANTPIGQASFKVTASKDRKPREVTQTIYAQEVTLNPPRDKAKAGFTPVKISVVIATEESPPAGEDPIEWVLLTSLDVSNVESALKVIQFYLCRWQIEIFFKILKSGCQIEKLQLDDKERFNPCLAMYLLVAWRLLYLTMLGRTVPEISCEVVFEPIEWQTAYITLYKKPPPKKVPTLQGALKVIAKLGGFLGRKADGPPGNIVMWRGLQALHHYIRAREALTCAYGNTYG